MEPTEPDAFQVGVGFCARAYWNPHVPEEIRREFGFGQQSDEKEVRVKHEKNAEGNAAKDTMRGNTLYALRDRAIAMSVNPRDPGQMQFAHHQQLSWNQMGAGQECGHKSYRLEEEGAEHFNMISPVACAHSVKRVRSFATEIIGGGQVFLVDMADPSDPENTSTMLIRWTSQPFKVLHVNLPPYDKLLVVPSKQHGQLYVMYRIRKHAETGSVLDIYSESEHLRSIPDACLDGGGLGAAYHPLLQLLCVTTPETIRFFECDSFYPALKCRWSTLKRHGVAAFSFSPGAKPGIWVFAEGHSGLLSLAGNQVVDDLRDHTPPGLRLFVYSSDVYWRLAVVTIHIEASKEEGVYPSTLTVRRDHLKEHPCNPDYQRLWDVDVSVHQVVVSGDSTVHVLMDIRHGGITTRRYLQMDLSQESVYVNGHLTHQPATMEENIDGHPSLSSTDFNTDSNSNSDSGSDAEGETTEVVDDKEMQSSFCLVS